MPWRLPPPIWIATAGKKAPLAIALHAGTVAWRLAKWSLAAGALVDTLHRLARHAGFAWIVLPWLATAALLVLLWERYRLGESAIGTGRCTRWMATLAIAVLGGAGTWLAAHAIAALLRSL